MNIRRLFRWLEQIADDSLYGVAQRCQDHLNNQKGRSYVLGGMVGTLACMRVRDCSQEQANRIVALSIEGAARLGLAYSFHPRKEILMALCEDLIACTLLAGKPLEDAAGSMSVLFSCIPKAEIFSSEWFQEIRSAVDTVEGGTKGEGQLPEHSLSVEPLYHQQRFLCETLVCVPYALSLAQQTTALALDSILSRHVKAAGKRLRVDQIERLEIELLSGVMDDTLKEQLAAQMVFHPDPIAPKSDWSAKQVGDIQNLIHLIQSEESDWSSHWNMEYQTLGGMYMTATKKEREDWIIKRGQLSWLRFQWMERTLKSNISIEEYTFVFPVFLRLYTSRGGCWKEKMERL